MQNKKYNSKPILLTGTYTTNLCNPPTTTGGTNGSSAPYDKTYIIIYSITFSNVTSGAITVRLYQGATGANTAGTELFKDVSIPANSVQTYTYPGGLYLTTSDFLVGGASAGSSVNVQFVGEIGVGQ